MTDHMADHMTGRPGRTKSLRRRLFVSHLLVMAVALGVLAVVVGAIGLTGAGKGRSPGGGQRGEGPAVLLVGLAAAATASGLVSWRVSRRLARPLEEIGDATRELAIGRYDVRVPGADTTELDALAGDVNQLAHELDTTEQRRLRLIGDVAHELRNPLSTIEGTMEALVDGIVAADDETYARIGRDAARLRRLAEDLSSLSAAGELDELNREAVDLTAIVADVVAQLEPQAAAKGLRLMLEPMQPTTVRGDGDRLTQVLTNVVGNAVQYTDTGGITVRSITDGPGAVIEVSDSGRGLAPDDLTQIFERFYRVDEHFGDGTGVGLAIAKLIVEAHGGTITAASPGIGRGTTLRIELSAVTGGPA